VSCVFSRGKAGRKTKLIDLSMNLELGLNGGMLTHEFLPSSARESRRLLVALHGLGDSAAGYRWLPQELQLPWMNYLLVNAPDPYYGGYSWYDFAGNPAPGIARSRKLLFELLDRLRTKGFPTEETVLFGFSQGCLMTVDVGFRYPQRFAGLVGISGYVHEPEKLLLERSPEATKQRMLFTQGTLDPLIPFGEVREQVNLLKAAGLPIEWHSFVKPHTIAGKEELDMVREFTRAGYSS
jgi:phospholipase/carboxylesterase